MVITMIVMMMLMMLIHGDAGDGDDGPVGDDDDDNDVDIEGSLEALTGRVYPNERACQVWSSCEGGHVSL